MDYRFAYLFADLVIFLPVWSLMFYLRKDLRHKMLFMSLLFGAAGPISEIWYLRDYWKPETLFGWPISFEDYLFGFMVGGIASVMYEEMFGKRFAKRYKRKHPYILLILPLLVVFLFVFTQIIPLMNLNSIYASSIAFLPTATAIYMYRKDLFTDSMMSGILFGLSFIGCYVILLRFYPEIFIRWWFLENLSGVSFLTIPIEEILWAFTFGMFAGPVYECYAGLILNKKSIYRQVK